MDQRQRCSDLHRSYVQGVAARARSLAPVLGADADLLEAAALLHDIGYAPGLAVTGLRAFDGARYLRDAQLCRLVAYHSCAIVEAGERGLADALGLEFEPAPYMLSSVLTYCDMTTSPDGELVPVESDSLRSITGTAPGTWSAAQSSAPRRWSSAQSTRFTAEPLEPHKSADGQGQCLPGSHPIGQDTTAGDRTASCSLPSKRMTAGRGVPRLYVKGRWRHQPWARPTQAGTMAIQ
jgi:hypothetical protein